MAIEKLTFTGVDVHTNTGVPLWKLANRWPETVEFGVLAGSRSGEGVTRFPPLEWVVDWRDYCINAGIPIALHLCGRLSRMVIYGPNADQSGEYTRLADLCDGFDRVQLNSANYPPSSLDRIAGFADRLNAISLILQRRDGGRMLDHPGIEYLFDQSGGRGKASFENWPVPEQGIRSGYSGGINVFNASRVRAFAEKHEDKRLWFDTESGVRTDGNFDLGKVETICEKVLGK